jgi:hypothetical protein
MGRNSDNWFLVCTSKDNSTNTRNWCGRAGASLRVSDDGCYVISTLLSYGILLAVTCRREFQTLSYARLCYKQEVAVSIPDEVNF